LAVAAFFLTPHCFRWVILLAASVIFYASWRIEFLSLLLFSTLLDYSIARIMPLARGVIRHVLLGISMCGNLGLLLMFKFLPESTSRWFDAAWQMDDGGSTPMLFLLPLGISFYTFQTLSYSIDVYRGKIQPEKHLGHFATYVMFFPQLLAGPIERFRTLMPQLKREQHFDLDRAAAGLGLFAIGMFKKVVLADGLAPFVNDRAVEGYLDYGLSSLLAAIGTIYRYYCDLSGYADMAIGSALIIGIKLSQNFKRPFAARTASGFWLRWHVTVTNWFRDYIYVPIALKMPNFTGNRFLATLLTMICVGLWHGASYSWLLIGMFAGTLISASNMMRKITGRATCPPWLKRTLDYADFASVWVTIIVVGAILASPSVWQAFSMLGNMASAPLEIVTLQARALPSLPTYLLVAIIALEVYQWADSRKPVHASLVARGRLWSWGFYLSLIAITLVFGTFGSADFLYFQF